MEAQTAITMQPQNIKFFNLVMIECSNNSTLETNEWILNFLKNCIHEYFSRISYYLEILNLVFFLFGWKLLENC